jgi:hypothetical protein
MVESSDLTTLHECDRWPTITQKHVAVEQNDDIRGIKMPLPKVIRETEPLASGADCGRKSGRPRSRHTDADHSCAACIEILASDRKYLSE